MTLVPDILRDRTSGLIIEVTGKCNLRCVYCSKADKIREALPAANADMDDATLLALYQYCKDNGIIDITLSGVGETAMLPGWHARLMIFLDDPTFKVHLISNFVRRFDDADLEAFSKLDALQISFDSADIEMVKRLRSRADLRTITYNIVRFQQYCRTVGRRPTIFVNAALCRENIDHLQALASFCRELQVDQLLVNEMMALTRNNPLIPETLSKLTNDEVTRLARQIIGAEEALAGSATVFSLRDHLELRISEVVERIREGREPNDSASIFHRPLTTSACVQPWQTPFVRADGNVYPCCIMNDDAVPVGNLADESLEQVVNGSRYRAIRQSIVEGRPATPCEGCSLALAKSFEELAAQLHEEASGVADPPIWRSQVERLPSPRLTGIEDAVADVENSIFNVDGDAAYLIEHKSYGFHRAMLRIAPKITKRMMIRLLVRPDGRRRIRFDLIDINQELAGRLDVVLKVIPVLMPNDLIVERAVSLISDGWYQCELSVIPANPIISIDFTLMRDDGAVMYLGDGLAGAAIKGVEILGAV